MTGCFNSKDHPAGKVTCANIRDNTVPFYERCSSECPATLMQQRVRLNVMILQNGITLLGARNSATLLSSTFTLNIFSVDRLVDPGAHFTQRVSH